MKNRRPFFYLSIAVAAAIAILLLEEPRSPRVDDGTGKTFSPGFDSANVMRVEVSQLLDGVVLRRDGKSWSVAEMATPLRKELLAKEGSQPPAERWFRADSTRVSAALGNFGGLGEGVIVSTNPEKEPLYRVDAKTGLSVKLLDAEGMPIVDAVIGKNGPDLASSYLRRASEKDVRLVRRALVGAFSPRVDDWRERKLWLFDPKDLVSMEVTPAGSPAHAVSDEKIIAKLAEIRAAGFPADPEKLPLDTPLVTVRVKDVRGTTAALEIFAAEADGRYPARLEGDTEVVLLTKDVVDATASASATPPQP